MSEQQLHIFYAEDDPLMIRMYERIFKLSDIVVTMAFTGEEAIEKLRNMSELPELILLDVMMPKVNGFEVLKFIKGDERLKNIPVVLLSNLANSEEKKRGMELGAVEYLVKSEHQPKDVVEKLHVIIKGKQNG